MCLALNPRSPRNRERRPHRQRPARQRQSRAARTARQAVPTLQRPATACAQPSDLPSPPHRGRGNHRRPFGLLHAIQGAQAKVTATSPLPANNKATRSAGGLARLRGPTSWLSFRHVRSETSEVELLGRYSNHADLVKPLVNMLTAIRNSPEHCHETVTDTTGLTARAGWRTADRLTTAEVADLAEQYQAGATQSALAEQFKISRGAVRRLLQRGGTALRPRGLTSEQVDEAARLYGEGWSLVRISERLSVDSTTVWHRLRERGVRMRDAHGNESPQ
jgi:hypothetical protein